MSIISSIFNSGVDQRTSTYNPEPSFLITITPNLYNGDPSINGQKVFIAGVNEAITLITINISGSQQITTLNFGEKAIAEFEGIYVTGFSCENYIAERVGNARINIVIKNVNITFTSISNNPLYDISSPLVDLFKAGFIVNISQYNANNANDSQQLFVGVIGDYNPVYNNNNISLSIQIDSFLTILQRSACVQTSLDQKGQQVFINTFTSQVYNFNNLLNQLLNETIISQNLSGIQYYKAPDETEAIGNNGSAIGTNSNIYVDTPPTDSKLKVIIRALYPYQRVFYVDNAGNFVITPLQIYFDDTQDWQITMNGEPGMIQGSSFSVGKKTSTIQNRTTTSLLQLYAQFNPTNNTSGVVGAVAVATPLDDGDNSYFPRLNDFINSGQYLQTGSSIQELNQNLLNNAGLLNIATKFNNITGLVNEVINIDDNADYIATKDENTNKLKYYLKLFAAKGLAEQLFSETQLSVQVPTNLTYNQNTGLFRTIPLNQLVTVPELNNKLLDGITQYFCYGYSLDYGMNEGAMTTLYLTKPYTYTALWSNEHVELLAVS